MTGLPHTATRSSTFNAAHGWWMVAVLFGMYVFSWLDRLIVSMLVSPIKADLALSDFQISLILGPAFAVFYALFGLPLGWATDRYSRRIVIFLGVVVWAMATVAGGFAHSFETLLLCRVFVGVGEAALLPAAYSMIADEFPRERLTLATSVFQTAGKVGSATAFGLGGVAIAYATAVQGTSWPIIGVAQGWQLVLIMVGLPGFLIALLVFTFREPERKDIAVQAQPSSGGTAAVIVFLRQHWKLIGLMMISFAFLAVCGYSMTSWVPTYIGRHFGWKPIEYGPALSLMNLFAAASLVVNGKIVDFLFARGMKDAHLRFYSWLILGLSPVIVSMFFIENAYAFLAMYGVVQIITVPFMVYVSAVIALLAPNAVRGQMLGLFMFTFNIIGFGAGPALVGALTDFVFRDESKLGWSLAVVLIGGSAIAYVSMRLALRYLAPAVAQNDGFLAPAGQPAANPA